VFSGADCSLLTRLTDASGAEPLSFLGGAGVTVGQDLTGRGLPFVAAGVPGDDEGGVVDAGTLMLFARASDCDGDGVSAYGGDCDDADPTVAPGKRELCDGKDNDCDGLVDEDVSLADQDGDGVIDCRDLCPAVPDPNQLNSDGDALGDACDPCPFDPLNDADGDGWCADQDNCPNTANPGQEDADGDGLGDACDPCPHDPLNDADRDARCADQDNCPTIANAGQEDADRDGVGDVCDDCPTVPNADQNICACSFCGASNITIQFGTATGHGSGLVSWSTEVEHDIRGFNIVTVDNRGDRTQLNGALIPCQECTTNQGASYSFPVPKHKSGRDVFIELVFLDGSVKLFGPAVKI